MAMHSSQGVLISLVFYIVPFPYFLLTFVALGPFIGSRDSAGQDKVAFLDSFPLLAGSNRILFLNKVFYYTFSLLEKQYILKNQMVKRRLKKSDILSHLPR